MSVSVSAIPALLLLGIGSIPKFAVSPTPSLYCIPLTCICQSLNLCSVPVRCPAMLIGKQLSPIAHSDHPTTSKVAIQADCHQLIKPFSSTANWATCWQLLITAKDGYSKEYSEQQSVVLLFLIELPSKLPGQFLKLTLLKPSYSLYLESFGCT